MPVQFKRLALNDNSPPAIIEDAFKAYGSFAGVHDFQFDSSYILSTEGWQLDNGLAVVIFERQGEWDDLVTKWDDGETGWA